MPGEERGRALAHEADAEAEEQPPQLAGAALLDPVQQVPGPQRVLLLALGREERPEVLEATGRRGRRSPATRPFSTSCRTIASPRPSMSIALRPREVLEPLLELRRAGRVRAPPVHLALGLHRRGAADGAALGRRPGRGPLRPLLLHHPHDLGDHLPAPLDEDGVAHPHVLARDLLLVVEGGPAHGGAGQRHRREVGDRGQLAGAAHLHLDRLDRRRRLHRGVLVGDRPAGELRREAELLLEGEVVDLDDDAVDLVLEASRASRATPR